ncbi:DUF6168 family protein [Polaribacter sp. KT 15]|uniref:DUF6168 family protein n=1 Tax=unclassified Polaribacter TaxID=196858 RepID=UPI00090A89B4|nr:DUF6168 family protein [Polaribacter sp. KT 15]SHM93477.1 hypothetical protein SAMN05720268_1496 [Polaribacter sp. KT 15]
MIKKIVIVLVVFLGLHFSGFFLHQIIIESYKEILPFNLQKLYLFHSGFSILICVNLLLLQSVNKKPEDLGYIYLGALFLKLLFFCVAFYSSIIERDSLSVIAKLSFLLPTFVFLSTEGIIVSKIRNKKL